MTTRISRRELMAAVGALPILGTAATAHSAAASSPAPSAAAVPGDAISNVTLPDRVNFPVTGVYLDCAYTHPFGRPAAAAAAAYFSAREQNPQSSTPRHNARNDAVERFARLIHAQPADIAVVPSTMEGENLINASLGIGPGAGVVTDAIHYDASLVLYGELQRRGAPLGVARPRGGRIDLADLKALFTRDTRLVAVSLVSNVTGFEYDLAQLCALAHAHGAYVYADIVQAAGAVPIDVKASGLDFACCGTYKWLMGDFGTAFLYVRPDRLEHLRRVQVGWRQVRSQESHVLPYETNGPALGAYALQTGTAGLFEVSTPAWGALATVVGSLDYIAMIGVDAIVRYRQPLIDRLHEKLPAHGFTALTPPNSRGPIAVFTCKDAEKRFAASLADAKIKISLYPNRIRVSPSVYNTMDDIDQLIAILSA